MDLSFISGGPTESFQQVQWIKMYMKALELPDNEVAKGLGMPAPAYAAVRRETMVGEPLTMNPGYQRSRGVLFLKFGEQGCGLMKSLAIGPDLLLSLKHDGNVSFREALQADDSTLAAAVESLNLPTVKQLLDVFVG